MRAVVVAVGTLLAAPVSAGAEQHTVAVPGKLFSPAQVTVVVGDEVVWRNSDLLAHDVLAVDGSFGSGVLGRFGSFSVRFDRAGAHPYLCTVHPFMRGQVEAVAAVLRGPQAAVLAGEPVRLEGRAAPGAPVTLEHRLQGASWHAVANGVAGADGAFSFAVAAAEGAVYRAVTVAGASPELALAVTAAVEAEIRVRPGHHRTRVRLRTRPASPGLTAVLQRYSRERFMWRRIDHARLDARGRAQFGLSSARGGRVRVLLARSVRGQALAVTDVVRVHDGARASDPAAPRGEPAPGHGHH
jgi:plastocyanin